MICLSRNPRGILLTVLLAFLVIEAAPSESGIRDEKYKNREESGNSDDKDNSFNSGEPAAEDENNKGKNANSTSPEGSGENSGITNNTKKSGESAAESSDEKSETASFNSENTKGSEEGSAAEEPDGSSETLGESGGKGSSKATDINSTNPEGSGVGGNVEQPDKTRYNHKTTDGSKPSDVEPEKSEENSKPEEEDKKTDVDSPEKPSAGSEKSREIKEGLGKSSESKDSPIESEESDKSEKSKEASKESATASEESVNLSWEPQNRARPENNKGLRPDVAKGSSMEVVPIKIRLKPLSNTNSITAGSRNKNPDFPNEVPIMITNEKAPFNLEPHYPPKFPSIGSDPDKNSPTFQVTTFATDTGPEAAYGENVSGPINEANDKGDWMDDGLRVHNEFRKKHGVPPLTLDSDLNRAAQKWADHLAEIDHFDHHSGSGENVAFNQGFPNPMTHAVEGWYSENVLYDYSTGRCKALKDAKLPDFGWEVEVKNPLEGGDSCLHFTQVVWKSSKILGLGKATAKSGKNWVVAQYRPPGNSRRPGAFQENVLRPISQNGGSSEKSEKINESEEKSGNKSEKSTEPEKTLAEASGEETEAEDSNRESDI